MEILLKSVKAIFPGVKPDKPRDILVRNGKIEKIGENLSTEGDSIDLSGAYVSPGWFDMQANFCDPGYEQKEDLVSGSNAAAAGGFTGVAVVTSTQPPLHSKAEIEYIRNKSKGLVVDVFPIGTITHNLDGKEISEMYDMHLSGAVAFSDDKKPVSNSGLLMRALLYAKNFGGLIMTHCEDKTISLDGKMNEGPISTSLGLKGIPALAEELMIARNIHLSEYTGTRIHISSVSTAAGVDLIRKAKKKGLHITCSVNAFHLLLNDALLLTFDSNYKVNPPLRGEEDIKALVSGLEDGTIDAITSDHSPEDQEGKVVEFDHATFGMISLETTFSMIRMAAPSISLERLVELMAVNPRKILNLPLPELKEGQKANFTFFKPDDHWTFMQKHIRSRSKNSPMLGQEVKGKVIGVLNNGILQLN